MAIQRFKHVTVNIGGTRTGSNAARQFAQIEDGFRAWALHLTAQSGEVLRDSLTPTLEKAKMYCPVKTGILKKSGYVEVRRLGLLRGYQAEIGFGRGGHPFYAIYVHEIPYRHKHPTRWKYLQAALSEDSVAIQRRIADGFRLASGT